MNGAIQTSPGNLLKLNESVTICSTTAGRLTLFQLHGTERAQLAAISLNADEPYTWKAPAAGGYQIVFQPLGDEPSLQRYLAFIDDAWAVCQITIGAFTSESFADVVHGAGVPVDYYVCLPKVGSPAQEPYAADDPRWRDYECRFGDAIHPHVMAADLDSVDPALAHHDANWCTLSAGQIEHRLRALQAWWHKQGYEPLDRIATYTPCNAFVQACRRVGIRILHSLVPEQNWSDGEWGINDWGMPNCPFWIAADDYRKPASGTVDGVLGMSMDHYGVLPPHLTRWGDHVLSPSHFLRWNRATDCGPEPVRFEQFLRDTLDGWRSLSDEPFFFSTGFEFGRTFGTSRMTDHNRLGLQRLIELSASKRLVFATSRDVRAYFDRHQRCHPESLFLQRDYWSGSTVNGKPGLAGDSLVIERADYKALVREGESLPMFHYDYQLRWDFPVAAEDAPEDFARQDSRELQVSRSNGTMDLRAERPLSRAVPVVAWDATVESNEDVATTAVPVLDDGRRHTLIELSAGWSGRKTIRLAAAPARVRDTPPAWWKTQTFGEGERRHTYLHFDLPLMREVTFPMRLRSAARIDAVQAPMGGHAGGRVELRVGPSRTWHRFWGVTGDDLECTAETEATVAGLRRGEELLEADWCQRVGEHTRQLHQSMIARTGVSREQIALEIFCGARLPLGERCRAAPYDIIHSRVDGLAACECGDGVIAYGPGRSFWYHPRGFPMRISGLGSLKNAGRIRLLLHGYDPLGLDACQRVTCGGHFAQDWTLPSSPFDARAWLMLDLNLSDAVAKGQLHVRLQTLQQQLLHDWWAERGFVASLHALWILTD